MTQEEIELAKIYCIEEWRTVIGYPDYEVSSHGRVKRITTGMGATAGKILACPPDSSKDNHRRVNLKVQFSMSESW